MNKILLSSICTSYILKRCKKSNTFISRLKPLVFSYKLGVHIPGADDFHIRSEVEVVNGGILALLFSFYLNSPK